MRDIELLKELGVKASLCILLFNLIDNSFYMEQPYRSKLIGILIVKKN